MNTLPDLARPPTFLSLGFVNSTRALSVQLLPE
jgi:hypothetical protein